MTDWTDEQAECEAKVLDDAFLDERVEQELRRDDLPYAWPGYAAPGPEIDR